jgi:hypothetical protein
MPSVLLGAKIPSDLLGAKPVRSERGAAKFIPRSAAEWYRSVKRIDE